MTQITNDTLITAISIAEGMQIQPNDHVFDWASDNGQGAIELYSDIGELATLSYDLMTRVAACPDFAEGSFPGVYTYEVDAEFGKWLADAMRQRMLPAGDTAPTLANNPIVKAKLGELALAFFKQAERPIPDTDHLVYHLTGYREITAVQVLPVMVHGPIVTPQFDGPNEKTIGWAVYDRLPDGTARHLEYAPKEGAAMRIGLDRAAGLGVQVEPWHTTVASVAPPPAERLVVITANLAFAIKADDPIDTIYDVANMALIPLQRHEGGTCGLIDYGFVGVVESASKVEGYDTDLGFELPHYEVQTRLANDQWKASWRTDGEPTTFGSEAEAKAALFDHLRSLEDVGMEFSSRDYRVVPVVPSAA